MNVRRKRVIKWISVVIASLIIGIVATVVSLAGSEQIERYWTQAVITPFNTANVTESIDYNFGSSSKHGIYREVPDLSSEPAPTAYSPDAPDTVQLLPADDNKTRIQVGDANTTVNGKHHYDLTYSLPTLQAQGDTVSWNAMGTEWTAGTRDFDAHLIAQFELDEPKCFTGTQGSTATCTVTTVAPGHLEVKATNLSPKQGITIDAIRGAALLQTPPYATAPTTPVKDNSINPLIPGGITFLFVLIGAIAGSIVVLRAGRERVGGTAPADIAYAKDNNSFERIDIIKLSELATTEFAPPKELTPAQGGVLLTEAVAKEQQTAWLMQAAVEKLIEIDGDKKSMTMRRLADPKGGSNSVLDTMFAGRNEIALGKYDKSFASGWSSISGELGAWQKSSDLWAPSGDRRRLSARVLGVLGLLLFGFIGFVLVSAMTPGNQTGIGIILAITSVIVGYSVGAFLFAAELKVRTPEGSALWLRTESFRRFIAASEAQHVKFAAEHDMLREYTAWAVALGEVDHWNRAMDGAGLAPEIRNDHLLYVAPFLIANSAATSTAPSSSSGGGGFSGGGGGGGGGGSW